MSNDNNNVLVIDTEGDDTQILEGMLSDDFNVTVCSSQDKTLEAVAKLLPGVIILDPAMPDLEILPIIDAAKALNPKSHIIFLSNLTTLDDSIEAYELGADDFIPKPYNPVELYHKVTRHVQESAQRSKLAINMEAARSTAFAAMESNSEMGIILRYMEEITSCNSYNDLGISLTQTVQSFDISAIAQIRSVNRTYNFGCADDSFEAQLLTSSLKKGKIIEGAHKIIINDERISLLLKNTPAKDNPKYGRIKDNIAMMMGATDARVTTINLVTQLETERASGLQSIMGAARESMHKIHENFTEYEQNIWQKIQEFREETERVLVSLGLSEEQEDTLIESLDQFVKHVMETDETKTLIETSFNKLLADLDKLN